jgi:hypothetical protein
VFTQGHRYQRHSSTPSLINNRQDGEFRTRSISIPCSSGSITIFIPTLDRSNRRIENLPP